MEQHAVFHASGIKTYTPCYLHLGDTQSVWRLKEGRDPTSSGVSARSVACCWDAPRPTYLKVGNLQQLLVSSIIHPKNEKIGGDYLSAQKNWRKKCVNLDDKILRQKGIIHKKFGEKSKKNGGDYLSAQKKWRKKCVNLDDKIFRQKGINHKN